MNGAFKHPLRVGTRLAWLIAEMAWIAANYIPRVTLRSDCSQIQAKARWLHWGCRRVIKIFGLEIQADKCVPCQGLLVSNHLSYVDILVFSALTPCVFVAKREVKSWPIFGWFATLAGTVFVDRRRRLATGTSVNAVESVLQGGALVVVFPEGTSSNGRQVLPFKSALLEPFMTSNCPVAASAIGYDLKDGDVAEEVCYWKDMTLLLHLLNLFSKTQITARARVCCVQTHCRDRKELARYLHSKTVNLNPGLASLADMFANAPSCL